MANTRGKKRVIGILTGGGDVPGLNPAIRAATIRAIRAGFEVIGIRKGWAGMVEIVRDKKADNSHNYMTLTEQYVNEMCRRGGTFLHTSRTNPLKVKMEDVPEHLKNNYNDDINDLTPDVLKNIEFLGMDYLIPIGGDDTLSYGVHLGKQGIKVVAIPKTMDNDVPGTDYCIGFSTCVSRTMTMVDYLRTSAGSHRRYLVVEVFGRYAGFTAMIPTLAGAATRCVIPEYKFKMEKLAEVMADDRRKSPNNYSVVLVSEGASFEGEEMVFTNTATDAFGHAKLGGIGDLVSAKLKELSPQFNNGKKVNVVNQKLGYIVRGGEPDAIDSIVPTVYGTLAMDLIQEGVDGRLVCLRDGRYDNVPLDVVTSYKKVVDVDSHYNKQRLRPNFEGFALHPMFVINGKEIKV